MNVKTPFIVPYLSEKKVLNLEENMLTNFFLVHLLLPNVHPTLALNFWHLGKRKSGRKSLNRETRLKEEGIRREERKEVGSVKFFPT